MFIWKGYKISSNMKLILTTRTLPNQLRRVILSIKQIIEFSSTKFIPVLVECLNSHRTEKVRIYSKFLWNRFKFYFYKCNGIFKQLSFMKNLRSKDSMIVFFFCFSIQASSFFSFTR